MIGFIILLIVASFMIGWYVAGIVIEYFDGK